MSCTFLEEFANLLSAVGGAERQQMLALIPQAKRIVLDAGLAAAVYDAVNEAPWSVESNLDLLIPPKDAVLWMEMDGYARRPLSERLGAETKGDDRVGYLVMRHVDDPNVLVAAVARKTPDRIGGACYLMPALCAVSVPELVEFAGMSRRYFDRERRYSQRRLVMMVRTYIPPGIDGEIGEIGKASTSFDKDQAVLAARGESAPEGVFLVAALLALSAVNVVVGDGAAEVAETPLPMRFALGSLLGLRAPEAGVLRFGDRLHLVAPKPVMPALPHAVA